MMREVRRAGWRKCTHSAGDGNCVEVATTRAGVGVRDTKNRAAGRLTVPHNAWQAFTHAVTGRTMR